MKYNTLYLLIITGFLFAGCGNKDQKSNADNVPAVVVQVNAVSTGGIQPRISASGKIEAVQSANISTRMMGYVDDIYPQIGDKVQKGQLLLRINNTDISAKLAQVNASITEASAAYTIAEKDFNRYSKLFNKNSASQKELDDITARYQMAKAQLESAQQMKNEVGGQLAYANIRAPFTGILTNKFIKEGDLAHPGAPLLELEAPDYFQVLAMVPESEIHQIQAMAKVQVLIKSLNETVNGEVTEVSTSSKNTGGQYLVKVLLDKNDVPILSGMFATVQFPVSEKAATQSVLIPKKALVHQGQLSGVYTVSQRNTALLRWLRLGKTFGDSVEVLSGLTTGEQYITEAQGKLFNGAKISIQ